MHQQPIQISDPVSFSQLFEETHQLVFRYIYSLHGGPAEEVEDLTADTYWKAWRARKNFKGNQSGATGWLLKIAKRLVIDDYRRRNSRGYELDIEHTNLPSSSASPEEQTQKKEQIESIFASLRDLSLPHREMITLRYVFGWRVKDIGEYLEIPENTVSVTIRRIFLKMKKELNQLEMEEESDDKPKSK